MDCEDPIVVDEDVLAGKPTVKGTRLAVEFVIDLVTGGWKEAEITKNYPSLDREDIRACLVYASRILKAERVYPGSERLEACLSCRSNLTSTSHSSKLEIVWAARKPGPCVRTVGQPQAGITHPPSS